MAPAWMKWVPRMGLKDMPTPIAMPRAIFWEVSERRMMRSWAYLQALIQPIEGQKSSLVFCKIVRGRLRLNIYQIVVCVYSKTVRHL